MKLIQGNPDIKMEFEIIVLWGFKNGMKYISFYLFFDHRNDII